MKINGSGRSESDKKRRRDFMCDEYKRRCNKIVERIAQYSPIVNTNNVHINSNLSELKPQTGTPNLVISTLIRTKVNALSNLSIDAKGSRGKIRNRCVFTGRPRGVYSYFKASRMQILELFNKGYLPGVRKSS